MPPELTSKLIEQMPVAAAMAIVVWMFLKYLQSRDADMKKVAESFEVVVRDNTRAIMDNSEMRGRVSRALEKLEQKL